MNYTMCIEVSSPDPVDVAATFVKLLVEKNELLSGSNNVVLWLAGRIRLPNCCLPFVPNTVQEFPTFTKLSSLSWISESASTVGPFAMSLDEEELELLDDLAECGKFWCRSCDNRDKDLEFEGCDLLWTNLFATSSCRLLCNFSFTFLQKRVKNVKHYSNYSFIFTDRMMSLQWSKHPNCLFKFQHILSFKHPILYMLERKDHHCRIQTECVSLHCIRTVHNISYFFIESHFVKKNCLIVSKRAQKIFYRTSPSDDTWHDMTLFVLGSCYKAQLNVIKSGNINIIPSHPNYGSYIKSWFKLCNNVKLQQQLQTYCAKQFLHMRNVIFTC